MKDIDNDNLDEVRNFDIAFWCVPALLVLMIYLSYFYPYSGENYFVFLDIGLYGLVIVLHIILLVKMADAKEWGWFWGAFFFGLLVSFIYYLKKHRKHLINTSKGRVRKKKK